MTDYERVKSLLTELGVAFSELEVPYEHARAIRVRDGLPGLYVQFRFFDGDGSLQRVGAYREGTSFACT